MLPLITAYYLRNYDYFCMWRSETSASLRHIDSNQNKNQIRLWLKKLYS